MEKFKHIHVHTDYSALDGLAKIEDLMKRVKEIGQTAIAITDHGTSSGLYEFQELGKKYGIKTVLGEEFYFQNADNKNGHIILLAKNSKGLENIYKLQELAWDNMYYKPRINLEMLKEYNEGLICTTACIANQVGQYILSGENILALKHITELKEIFHEDFYLELQSSTVADVITVNKQLMKWIESGNYKYVITNDVHYTKEEDYNVHEVLLCIQQKSKMDSPKRWKFENNDYWLKTEYEIKKYMPYISEDFWNDALSYIDEIFNKCNATIESGNYLPKWEDDNGLCEDDCLEKETWGNYLTRIKDRQECNEEFKSDLQKELSVIKETGYSGYFMIVQEYCNWAKSKGILVGDGRGSGAGSKVAYTIGITEVNPQKYNLLFERFLSIGRQPDFDVDFSDINAVYKHLQDKYGERNVARVGAFNRFTCKSALRKVMGVYGFSQAEISKIVGLLPNELSFTLNDALVLNAQFKEWCEKNRTIYNCVKTLEGVLSHMSTHAGGVVICKDLTKKLPTFRDSKDKEKLVIGYDKHIVEDLGHYKFDILGLNSLNLLKNTLNNIKEEINWDKINWEDKKVFEMLSNGDVDGVFQLSEQRDKVTEQEPETFEDLISINALIRPGVADWNEYIRRRNASDDEQNNTLEFMRSTSGLIVYQDQYLLLANHYAGWGIAYSDKHIRKNKHILEDTKLKEKFITDSCERGYEPEETEKIWDNIAGIVAGGYGFNRAHSTSYARLSYQTAWLKCYYPKEFYAALLTQNFDDNKEIVKIHNLLKQLGIKLLPPDINKSTDKFEVTDEGILYSLNAIKGIGGSVLYEINRLRPIKSFEDFMSRRTPKFVKKTAVEALIKTGAFDNLSDSPIEVEPYNKSQAEKQYLGIYLADSPFEKYDTPVFNDVKNGESIKTVWQIESIKTIFDKKGDEMAFITGINKSDSAEGIIFGSFWKKIKNKPSEGDLCYIEGSKDGNKLIIYKLEVMVENF